MAKILIVEDDRQTSQLISDLLRAQRHTTEVLSSGLDAAAHMRELNFDLIVLDWELPGKTGIELCAEFRAAGSKTPILMLTGKTEFPERIAGLNAGADDYLPKPFNTGELVARVSALLRRPGTFSGVALAAGHITLDPETYRVTSDGKELSLLAKEYALLEYLLRHKGRTTDIDTLVRRVWESEAEVSTEAVRQCMARLRKKIDRPGEPSLIKTVVGIGYKLEE